MEIGGSSNEPSQSVSQQHNFRYSSSGENHNFWLIKNVSDKLTLLLQILFVAFFVCLFVLFQHISFLFFWVFGF